MDRRAAAPLTGGIKKKRKAQEEEDPEEEEPKKQNKQQEQNIEEKIEVHLVKNSMETIMVTPEERETYTILDLKEMMEDGSSEDNKVVITVEVDKGATREIRIPDAGERCPDEVCVYDSRAFAELVKTRIQKLEFK